LFAVSTNQATPQVVIGYMVEVRDAVVVLAFLMTTSSSC